MSSISPHNETNTTPNISIATPTPNTAADVRAPSVAADAEEASSVEQQRFQKLRTTTPIFADSSSDNTKGHAPNADSDQQLRDEEAEQQRVTDGVSKRVAVAVLSPMDIETEAEDEHKTKKDGGSIAPSSSATAQQPIQQQQPYVCPTPSATPSKGRRATSTYKTAKDVMGGNVKNSDFGIGDRNAPTSLSEISAADGGGEGGGGAPATNINDSGSSRQGIFSRILSIFNRVMPSSPIVIRSGPHPIEFKRLDLSDVTPATFLFDSDKANRNSALAHRHMTDGTEAVVAAHHPTDAAVTEASQMSAATPKTQRRSPKSTAATPQKGGAPQSTTKGSNNNLAYLGPSAHPPYHQLNPYAPNGPSPWQQQQPHLHPGDPNFFAPYANTYNPYAQQQQAYPPFMMGVPLPPPGAGGGMFSMYPQQGAVAGSTRKASANAALFGAVPPPPPGYAEATTPAASQRRSRAASINLSRNEEGGAPAAAAANEVSTDASTPPVEAVVSRNPSKCVSRSIMGHAHKTPLASRAPSPNASYRAGAGAPQPHNENSSAILNAERCENEAANPSTPPPPSYNNATEAAAHNNNDKAAAVPSSAMRLSLAALQQHMPNSTTMAAGGGSFTPASRRSVAVAGHPSPASYQNTPHSAMYRLPLSQQQAQHAAAILDSNTLAMMMGHAISNNNSFANSSYSHASTPQHHSRGGGGGGSGVVASAPAAAYCSHCGSSTPTAMQQQQQLQLPLQRQSSALMPPPPPPQMPLRSNQPRPQQQQQHWVGGPTHVARQPYSNNSSINNAFVAAPPPPFQQPYGAAPITAPFAAKGSLLPQQPFYGDANPNSYGGGGYNYNNNNSVKSAGGGVGYGYGGGGGSGGFGGGPAPFPFQQQQGMMMQAAEPPLSHNKYGFLRRMKTKAYKDHQKELEADLEEEDEAQQQQFFLQ